MAKKDKAKKASIFTLVFMAGAAAGTLGQVGKGPDAIVRNVRRQPTPTKTVSDLDATELATWEALLGVSGDYKQAVLSKPVTHKPGRVIVGGQPRRLTKPEAATLDAALLLSADCAAINAKWGDESCDPATQRYTIKIAKTPGRVRLITTYTAALGCMGPNPPLPAPPPEDLEP